MINTMLLWCQYTGNNVSINTESGLVLSDQLILWMFTLPFIAAS